VRIQVKSPETNGQSGSASNQERVIVVTSVAPRQD
jgi:hypothetical protein